jgi:hypothetical protein
MYLAEIGTAFEPVPVNTFVMKSLLRLVLFGLFLSSAHFLVAQNLIFYQNTRSSSFLMKQHGGGPSEGLVDHFIGRIAAGSNKNPSRTEFIIAADENIRLTQVNSTQYDVNVTIENLRFSGDTQYRGFFMTEQLQPSAIKFNLERISKTGQVVEVFAFDNVQLNGPSTLVANFRAVDSTRLFLEQTMRLSNNQFIYIKEAKGIFDQRTILIDDYYAAIPKMEALNTDFKKINPDDFERIETQQNDLNQLIIRLNAITSSNFPENLDLAKADPAGFNTRYQQLNASAQDLNARIQLTKSQIPDRYYQRGLTFLQQNKPALANADFNEALRLRPNFAEPHLELARLRYREGDIAAAKVQLLSLFNECAPSEQTSQAARQLGNTIYQNHIGNADYAIKQKRFASGLQSIAEARSLCTDLKLTCTNQLEDLSSLAHGGIFQAMVDSARLSYQAQKFEESELRATEAIAYQKLNALYIKDPSPALRAQADAQTKIYQNMVASANALAGQNKLKEAENAARAALAYQLAHSGAIAQPNAAQDALNRIMDLEYKDNIAQAKTLQAQKQFRPALALLDEAIVIETKFPVTKDANIWNLAQSNAKPIILEDALKGQELAKGNQLAAARTLTQATKSMADQYKLADDPQVSAALSALTGAIFSQECTNAQLAFDAAINEAQQQKRNNRFIDALASFEKALKIASDQAVCGIDNRRGVEGKLDVSSPAKYQRLLNDAQAAVDRNDSKVAIDTYLNAGQLALSDNLKARFAIQHPNLFDFISGSGKLEFVRYGATYFLAQKDLDASLALLQKTVQMGVSKGLIKDLMKRLGTELAIRDREVEPNSDAKIKAAGYTQGNKKLKILAKTYTKLRK